MKVLPLSKLFVGPSQIKGKGLFVKCHVKKNTYLCKCTGKIQHTADIRHPHLQDNCIRISPHHVLNMAYFTHNRCKASFINDANGVIQIPNVKNNTVLVHDFGHFFVQALEDLYPGQELFMAYGEEYWKIRRQFL
jgi:SET domain-containing protein